MEFIKHLFIAVEITNDKMISSFCYDRNKYLESKFKMHQMFLMIIIIIVDSTTKKKLKTKSASSTETFSASWR